MNKKIFIAVLLIFGWGFYIASSNRWIDYDKNVIVKKDPVQEVVSEPAFRHKGFTILPMASLSIEARLLSKSRYLIGKESKLAPLDFALGWGPMSDYQVLKKLKISQSNRWYYYWYKQPPISKKEIISHSANMHLIAANNDVAKMINKARRGEILKLNGYLVNVSLEDGWHWNSSLSRNDTGSGSCEVFWVKNVEIK